MTNFRNPLILWDYERGCWQDPHNDFLLKERDDGGWRVSARNGFTDESVGWEEKDFPQFNDAMEFYVNYLEERRARLTEEAHERRIKKKQGLVEQAMKLATEAGASAKR